MIKGLTVLCHGGVGTEFDFVTEIVGVGVCCSCLQDWGQTLIGGGIYGGVKSRSCGRGITDGGCPFDVESSREGGACTVMIDFERARRASLEESLDGITSRPTCPIDHLLEGGYKARGVVVDITCSPSSVGFCPSDGGGGFGGVWDPIRGAVGDLTGVIDIVKGNGSVGVVAGATTYVNGDIGGVDGCSLVDCDSSPSEVHPVFVGGRKVGIPVINIFCSPRKSRLVAVVGFRGDGFIDGGVKDELSGWQVLERV